MVDSRKEMMKAIEAWNRETRNWSRQQARDYLINVLGTHNPDGTLTKEYGGEYTMKNQHGS